MSAPSRALPLGIRIRELLAFGGVGGIATLVHVAVFSLLLETTAISPLQANLLAFSVAFLFSFSGHYHLTFGHVTSVNPQPRRALLRFLVVALIGLALNSAVVELITGLLHLHYFYAVALMVTAVPACLFLLSKYWAFAAPKSAADAGPVDTRP